VLLGFELALYYFVIFVPFGFLGINFITYPKNES
jgi:hypothetical protein